MSLCLFGPLFGFHPGTVCRTYGALKTAMRVTRLGNDARVVASAGQNECDFCSAQMVQLVDRAPWRDMVALCPHHEYGLMDIAQ